MHADLETSRSVYNWVCEVCEKLGADPDDLVPFEKYAAAANELVRPSSAARALNNGVPNIERTDRLVQLIGAQFGMQHPVVDETVEQSTRGWPPTAKRPPAASVIASAARQSRRPFAEFARSLLA